MKKALITTTKLLVGLLAIAFIAAYFILRSSLPTLDGEISAQIDQKVVALRDANGIPSIIAQNRGDLAYALGYLHAQERYFQMDLLRRNSAGELSELFGTLAVDYDKEIRNHQFRKRAEQYSQQLNPAHQELLLSYTTGVNQGLKELSSKPFEYWILNKQPLPWRKEDSLLVLYSMYLDLQYQDGQRERTLGALKANLMPDVYQFLNPAGSQWDAAIDGTQFQPSPMPSSNFDLAPMIETLPISKTSHPFKTLVEPLVGSNNWAVGGEISETGSAIVADDMHLGISVPNIWYRASMRYQSAEGPIRLDGVTLPGLPAQVVGSNGKVAWGFTNSYGDWNDVIQLTVSEDERQYLTPDGYQDFQTDTELVLVSGQTPVNHEVRNTIWGPVIGRDANGKLLAMRWVAHDLEGINFNLLDLELANDVEQAIEIANSTGIPAQNFMVGDSKGNIAWTIAGPMPEKFGLSNSDAHGWAVPQDWSKGDKGWRGYLTSEQYPKVINPDHHRLWTGNSRVVGNQMLEKIGNGGYALGARSQQIRDDMFALEQFSEQDLLDIQNDDRAVFLQPWQQLLLNQVLTFDFVAEENLAELVGYIENWQGRAAVDSVGYLFVREFRLNLRDQLFNPITKGFEAQQSLSEKTFSLRPIRHQLEIPMWQMIEQQPSHLLPGGFSSWQALLQQTVRETLTELQSEYGSLQQATWGARNTLKIQHPLSKAVPPLGYLLDMPAAEVNGDSYMPRVQGPAFGASQRLVVSPGHEERGILHMPSTQSGHPLSPFYGVGHQDWVEGNASPLLPGKPEYKLTFVPDSAI